MVIAKLTQINFLTTPQVDFLIRNTCLYSQFNGRFFWPKSLLNSTHQRRKPRNQAVTLNKHTTETYVIHIMKGGKQEIQNK